MPVERFYAPFDLKGTVQLQGAEHHHLVNVLRIRTKEEVELVNGRGELAKAQVETISRHDTTLKILSCIHKTLPPPRLKLALPLMRLSKLELVIEKCTELGSDSFLLYRADFSEKSDLSEHQFERLEYIAISAMKQCGRLDLPPIELTTFEKILALDETLLFGDTRLENITHFPQGKFIFITGSERGFSEKELLALERRGRGIKLNKNILRAETAPIAAAAICTNLANTNRNK